MKLSECPVRITLEVIGGKWKPVILYFLRDGPQRHGELRRLIPEATQKMLTQQLRELERDGVIVRRVFPGKVTRVEYATSELGETLRPVIKAMCRWGRAQMAETKPVSDSR